MARTKQTSRKSTGGRAPEKKKEPAKLLPMSPIASPKTLPVLPPLPKLPPLEKEKAQPSLPPLKKEVSILTPTETPKEPPSTKLPPLPKTTLPPLKKATLPPSTTLPPLKSTLPPLPKTSLPALKKLPPPIKEGASKPVVLGPLAKEVREKREEQIPKITEEAEEKILIQAKPTEKKEIGIIGISEDIKEFMAPLKPLSGLPSLAPPKTALPTLAPPSLPSVPRSLPAVPKSALATAQEGVVTAKLTEPEAAFQKKALPKLTLPPLTVKPTVEAPLGTSPASSLLVAPVAIPLGESTTPESLSVVASPANLPSKRSADKTPKIRIPKIRASPVRPAPKGRKKTVTTGITLPTTSTVIPSIPITSPTPVSKVSVATTSSSEIMENIMKIDFSKLRAERSTKKETYSVADLKSIAGSLNLTKSGSKRELVERIKSKILQVNPNVVFE